MNLRISRLRFVIVRSFLVFTILLCIIELTQYFQNDKQLNKSPMEILFWQNLYDKDKMLTHKQRIKTIESIENNKITIDIDWNKWFYKFYEKKLNTINKNIMFNVYKYVIKQDHDKLSQETFEIFEETLVFQSPKFCSTNNVFHSECPYKNCKWTCQKTSTINSDNRRRASVFHHVDINKNDIQEKLKYRSYNDIWILWIDEANREIEHLNQYKFNWTLSFRQDSEVSIGTYGVLIENENYKEKYTSTNNKSDNTLLPDFVDVLTNRNVLTHDYLLENRILTNYRYRLKHALWFVSNCQPTYRLKYYKQLKRYYPIDAFGLCVNNENKCNKNEKCEVDRFRLAMFYLAFESQTCADYVTEKFWRALHFGMIPVVSGPKKQSYLDLGVPESAFIHVDDFQSVKQLGKYLHDVSNDYFLYRKYFQWVNQYEIFYKTNDLEPIRMCELCMRLNMQDLNEHRYYTNIHQWHRSGC